MGAPSAGNVEWTMAAVSKAHYTFRRPRQCPEATLTDE